MEGVAAPLWPPEPPSALTCVANATAFPAVFLTASEASDLRPLPSFEKAFVGAVVDVPSFGCSCCC